MTFEVDMRDLLSVHGMRQRHSALHTSKTHLRAQEKKPHKNSTADVANISYPEHSSIVYELAVGNTEAEQGSLRGKAK